MTIQEALQNILQAVFGKDVRQSIHDGIDAINKESKADMEAKQAVIDRYTAKQDSLDQKYDRLLDEMSQANPSLAEVVDARENEEGTVFTNLRDRLNDSDLQQKENKNDLLGEIENLRAELISKKADSDTKISSNQTAISNNQTNISNTNNSLTSLRNDVNSYKTTTNNRVSNLEYDSGWNTIPLNPFSLEPYSGSAFRYRIVGKVVNIRGALTPHSVSILANGSDASVLMMALPGAARPTADVITIHQGSGKAIFMSKVGTDGNVTLSRYREGTSYLSRLPDKAWLPINITYIAG